MTEVTLIKHFPLADYAVVNRGTEYQPFVACWSFRHHAPIMGIDDVPFSVTDQDI